jgi:hypothetical protein
MGQSESQERGFKQGFKDFRSKVLKNCRSKALKNKDREKKQSGLGVST